MRILSALAVASLACLTGRVASACTTFLLAGPDDAVVGKSYDWNRGDGLVLVNKRNVAKTALAAEHPAMWVSKYGSVTFNQHGREFPLGGMNEAGLVVEIMWLDEATCPAPDERPVVNELQWIQYQLDTAATVPEVIENANGLRVAKVYAAVHYLVCDRTAVCGTFEYLNGKLVVHTGETMPVHGLTNSTYAESLAYWKSHHGFTKGAPPKGLGSLERFARANVEAREFKPDAGKPATDSAMAILASVSMGSFSKWNLAYDIRHHRIAFRTVDAPGIKSVRLDAFDYSCATPVRMLDMNGPATGDVTTQFVDFAESANRQLVSGSLAGLGALVPKGLAERVATYGATTQCR